MIAALLGDLDNSAGQGAVYFRQDNGSNVLSRVGELVKEAFPRETVDEPQDTTVVTWENMSARGGASGRGDGLDAKVSRLCAFFFVKGTCFWKLKTKVIFFKVLFCRFGEMAPSLAKINPKHQR